ncbi:MAG: 2Fe-2S iron-sulfur cluster-binding protein [Acidiferrobacter sp.]
MPEWLTLTRAARLIGVSRGMLQKRVQEGALQAFEGKVALAELVRAYPQARFEDSGIFERLAQIKDEAFAHRVREHILPDPEVLMARLQVLTKELIAAKSALEHHRASVARVREHLEQIEYGDQPDRRRAATDFRLLLERELALGSPATDTTLLMQEYFLRIMAAQVLLRPSNHEFLVEGSDTILDAALRSGLALNYGCSNGNCGLCKAKVITGETKRIRHHDFVLTDTDKGQGYILLCAHTAVTDVVIEAPEAEGVSDIPRQVIHGRVKTVQMLTDSLALLHVQTPRTARLRFLAGQRVWLQIFADRREYPIASCPCDDRNLQFLVRTRGTDTGSLVTQLKSGDIVPIEGPTGTFVLNEQSHRPLLFIAYDLGFAPIKSLIEHAMALNVAETMGLYWITESERGPYLHNLCRSWSDALDQFQYMPFTATSDEDVATVLQQITAYPELVGHDVYIAGPLSRTTAAAAALCAHGLPAEQVSVDGSESTL